jgi:branched-chain amino acid transport system substrate-binding protein
MEISLKGMLAGLLLSTALGLGGTAIANAGGDEIVIGAPISLTGPLAGDGKEQKWA